MSLDTAQHSGHVRQVRSRLHVDDTAQTRQGEVRLRLENHRRNSGVGAKDPGAGPRGLTHLGGSSNLVDGRRLFGAKLADRELCLQLGQRLAKNIGPLDGIDYATFFHVDHMRRHTAPLIEHGDGTRRSSGHADPAVGSKSLPSYETYAHTVVVGHERGRDRSAAPE